MSTDPFGDDHARSDAMAEQMQAVIDVVGHWDSPGLYANAGARQKCLEVARAHHLAGTENLNFKTQDWDLISEDSSDILGLPQYDPNNPEHQAVPRLIFAKNPKAVRIFRGGVLDAIGPYLLSIARGSHWRCDWSGSHRIQPTMHTDTEGNRHVTFSRPYLVTKARGEFLLVFVVCTQCLEVLISRGSESFGFGPNNHDRELIDGKWLPIWRNPHKAWLPNGASPVQVTQWEGNEDKYPDQFYPAAYLINGIRFVIPHSTSGWREDDNRTYDNFPV
ncbi:hypothetical protein [Mycobacterium simiae]|uniref:Uncharacterized protein n=1 Tax=Mycobacterium simiae TaxID=1784 RepID=A0A1X0YFD2_MYCSI|nr:hypothetical protein [Mycobacterium simiae]ORJ63836.1 hypothetical protein B5M45_04675 [Mycobacterium simiae]